MKSVFQYSAILLLAGTTAASTISAQNKAAPAAPKARYAIDVGTQTGMAAMGSGAGGALSMMFGGGGNKVGRELRFRIGSTASPDKGAAKIDHFLQPAAKLGKSVPLLVPDRAPSEIPTDFQRPKGRLILFWGCGAKAAKGQPVIIDFAKVAAGQIPPGLFSTRVPVDPGPMVSNSRTYADWPNKKTNKTAPSDSSVLGEHRIASNIAPEIKFSLTQDYMPGINGKSTAMPGGATNLTWNGVTGATGFLAFAMGGDMSKGEPTDFVWWTSSTAKEFGGGLWDWLPPSTVQRLIGEKVVMPPSQTSCTIPAEVKTYAPNFMMGSLYAYGPEANFAFPPRPATGPWNPDWTARVRYRSMTSWFITSPGGMMAASDEEEAPKKKCKPSVFGVLTGSSC
jgi:hypothetical protein